MPTIIEQLWEDRKLEPSQKLLLLAIAKHARADGRGAYPSLRRLEALTGFALSTVCDLLPHLVDAGYLTIHHRQGPNGTNLYDVHARGVPVDGAPEDRARSSGAPLTLLKHKTERKTELPLRTAEHRQPVLRSPEHPSPKPDPPTPEEQAKLARQLGLTPESRIYAMAFPRPPDPARGPQTGPADWRAPTPPVPGAYLQAPCRQHISSHIEPDGRSWRIKIGKTGWCLHCAIAAQRYPAAHLHTP